MAEKIYKTDYEIDPPLLLELEQLQKLDEIIEKEWPNLLDFKNSRIKTLALKNFQEKPNRGLYKENSQAEVEAKLEEIQKDIRESYRFKGEKVTLTLYLKNGDSIHVGSFSEALKNKDIHDTKIVGFKLTLVCGELNSELEIKPRYPTMELSVRPPDLRISSELFLELKRWMNIVKAPLWQRLVRKFSHSHWIILLCLLMLISNLGVKYTSADWSRINQAHELLENGIEADQYGLALETILALLTDYDKPESVRIFAPWYKILIISGIITCVLLSTIPKVVLDIGKNEGNVRWWRSYLRFISITIPLAIFSSFILPYIQQWISSLFID